MAKQQDRIVELQRQLKITRDALTQIANGCRNPEAVAGESLYSLHPLDKKYQLQGLVGHEKR